MAEAGREMEAMQLRFTVPGRPVGYYTQGARPNWRRLNAYRAYKQHVQAMAKVAGLRLPLAATREAPVTIRTVSYFENGVHCDPENVHKGVVDALFWSAKRKGAGDKYTGGQFEPPRYDEGNPRVEVEVVS